MIGAIPSMGWMIGAVVAGFIAGFGTGWTWADTSAQAKLTAAYAEKAAIEEGRDELVGGLVSQYEEDHRVFDTTKTKLVRDVARYRHNSRDFCDLSGDWRVLHNRAAALSAPDSAAAEPDAAAAAAGPALTDADALEVVVDNYALAAQCNRQLKLWQDWWSGQNPPKNP